MATNMAFLPREGPTDVCSGANIASVSSISCSRELRESSEVESKLRFSSPVPMEDDASDCSGETLSIAVILILSVMFAV